MGRGFAAGRNSSQKAREKMVQRSCCKLQSYIHLILHGWVEILLSSAVGSSSLPLPAEWKPLDSHLQQKALKSKRSVELYVLSNGDGTWRGGKSSTGWWFQPIWKILVKLGNFPNFRGENKKYLKPPRRVYLKLRLNGVIWMFPKIVVSPNHPF